MNKRIVTCDHDHGGHDIDLSVEDEGITLEITSYAEGMIISAYLSTEDTEIIRKILNQAHNGSFAWIRTKDVCVKGRSVTATLQS